MSGTRKNAQYILGVVAHSKRKKECIKMNANAELLNFVYQNSQMGVDTLQQLIEISEDIAFKEVLERHLTGYEEFHKRARRMLNQNGFDEKGLTGFEKMRTYLMVNLQTMNDHSSSKIAGMLINGSSMGITDAIKKLHKYEKETEKDIQKLMEELCGFEEKKVEELKEFL